MKHNVDTNERTAARAQFRTLRWVVLLGILTTSTAIGFLHQKAPELRLVGVDALCPFGGIESLWELVTTGGLMQRIAWGSFVLLIGAALLNLVFGRAFCGQICPLGTLQELAGSLRSVLKIRRRALPESFDRPARYLKYLVLIVFAVASWRAGELLIRPYDPWVAFHHVTSSEVLTEFSIGLGVLTVSLVASVVYDRFFCKYLCPMGAVLGTFSRFAVFKVTRHPDACVDCGACNVVCPHNIAVDSASGAIADPECISCGLCVAACPAPDALDVRRAGGEVFTPAKVTAVSLAVVGMLVFATSAVGLMRFQADALTAASNGTPAQATSSECSATPEARGPGFDVSLIKGYHTMAEVSQATGIPAAELQTEFKIAPGQMNDPLRGFKATADWDTQAVRDYVAKRLGVPTASPSGCE